MPNAFDAYVNTTGALQNQEVQRQQVGLQQQQFAAQQAQQQEAARIAAANRAYHARVANRRGGQMRMPQGQAPQQQPNAMQPQAPQMGGGGVRGFIGNMSRQVGQILGGGQQGGQQAPVQQGALHQAPSIAPSEAVQPQVQQMPDGSMREVEQVKVTGIRPPRPLDVPRMPSQEQEGAGELQDAWAHFQEYGDPTFFNQAVDGMRSRLSAEQKQMAQQFGGVANELLRYPQDQRAALLRGYLERNGIDPETTTIDDDVSDFALSATVVLGDPAKSAEGAIEQLTNQRKEQDQLRYAPFTEADSTDRLRSFDPRTGTYSVGIAKGISAEERFKQGQQTTREGMGNATAIRIAEINGARAREIARIQADTTLTVAEKRAQSDAADRKARIEIASINREAAGAYGVATGKYTPVPSDDLPPELGGQ